MRNIEKISVHYEERTLELLNKLLDMNIEITLEVDEKGTIFINRPHIPYYDDKEDIGVVPLDRSISLYVKRDGEFYDNWDFSMKKWINDLTFLSDKRKYGEYELTLVYGYDEVTGEYTPISNTIIYTLNGTDDYHHPHSEYESIPFDGTDAEIKSGE